MKKQCTITVCSAILSIILNITGIHAQAPPCQIPTFKGELSACLNGTYTYEAFAPLAVGSSMNWSISPAGGYTITSPPPPGSDFVKHITWTTPGTRTLTIYPSGCAYPSFARIVTITVSATPTATPSAITGSLTPCLGGSVYSVDPQPGNSFIWTIRKDGIVNTDNPISLNSGGNIATIAWTSPGNNYSIEVYSTNGTCNSSIVTRYGIRVGTPTPTIAKSMGTVDKACKNSSATYYGYSGYPETYSWSLSPDAGTISNMNGEATVVWGSLPGPHTLTLTTTNGCGSATKNVQVTLEDNPVKPIITTSKNIICNSSDAAIINIQNYTAGIEYLPTSGQGYSFMQYFTNNVPYYEFRSNTPGTYTFSFTARTTGFCESPPSDPITITVIDPNAQPVVLGSQVVCMNSGPYTYSVQSPYTNYTWTVPPGTCLVNGTTLTTVSGNSVSILWTTPGIHSLIVRPTTTPCGNSIPYTLMQVTVQQPIIASSISEIIGSSSVCINGPGIGAKFPYTISYNDNISEADEANLNVNWAVSGGGFLSEVRPRAAIIQWNATGNHTVTAYVSNSCGGTIVKTISVIPTISAPSYLPGISGNNSACINEVLLNTVSPAPPPSTQYAWNTSGTLNSSGPMNAAAVWKTPSSSHFISYGITGALCDEQPFIKTIGVSKLNQSITTVLPNFASVGATIPLTQNSSAGLPLSYSVSDPLIATLSGYNLTFIAAGTVTVFANQDGNFCYNPAKTAFKTIPVSIGNQTITFNSLLSKVYGDAPFGLIASSSSGLPISFTSSNPLVATVNGNTLTIIGAGITTITASQSGNANYYPASEVAQTLTITKANQAITFAPLPDKNYGSNPVTLSGTSSAGLVVSYTSSNTSVATVNGNTMTIRGVGSTTITALQAGNSNYNAASSVQQTLTVTKAVLTVTANSLSKTYGTANPTSTISYAGFVNGETASVIDTAPTVSTTATLTSNAGTYPITVSGGSDNNYTFTYVSGTLTINKAMLQVTADNKTRTYGATNPTYTFSYSGFLNGDTPAVIDTPPTGSTSAGASSNVGSYTIIPSGGTDNNYTFNYVNGTFTVSKATIQATANASRAYNTANPVFTITYTGLMNGETGSVIDTPPTAATTAITSSPVGSYTITLSGGTDNNYSITRINGTLTITKANQTVTFSPIPTKCGTGTVTLVATASSGLGVTFSSSNTSIATISGSSANALQTGTVTITATQTGNANYNTASATQSLVIASLPPKPLISQIGCVCEQYVTLQATGGSNYVWSTGYVGQTVNMVTSAGYYVTSTNANGCSRQSNLLTVTIPSCASDPCGGGPQSRIGNDNEDLQDELWVTEPSLYPNPADATLTVQLREPVKQNVTVSLFSQYGQEVKSAVLVKGEYKIEFDTKLLSNGMYVLTLQTTSGNINMNRRVIINH